MSSSPKSYQEVKIKNGQLIDNIKNHKQSDWKMACEKLGLNVRHDYGAGSHCAVYKPGDCPPEKRDCCILTIPSNVYRQIQRNFFKKVLLYGLQSGDYTEDDIWEALGVKK